MADHWSFIFADQWF